MIGNPFKILFFILILFIVFCSSSGLFAITNEDEIKLFEEEVTIVTASKKVEPLGEVAGSVMVITAQQLADMGALTIADALMFINSMEIIPKALTRKALFFRGIFNAMNQTTLLLIDGRPVNDVVSGTFYADFKQPIDHIKQIEIITGPGSALYGANAFAGVINIITRRGMEMNTIYLKGGLGSYGEKFGIISGGQELEGVEFAFTLRSFSIDGETLSKEPTLLSPPSWYNCDHKDINFWGRIDYKAFNTSFGYTSYDAGRPGIPYIITPRDQDQIDNFFIDSGFKLTLNEKAGLNIRGSYTEFKGLREGYDEEYNIKPMEDIINPKVFIFSREAWDIIMDAIRNGTIPDMSDLMPYLVSTDPRQSWGDYYISYDDIRKVLNNEFPMKEIKDFQYRALTEFQFNYAFNSSNNFLCGTEYRYEFFDDVPPNERYTYNIGKRIDSSSIGTFAQHQLKIGEQYYFLFGARYDYHSIYKGFFSPRLDFLYRPVRNFAIRANFGRAFRAPNYLELYAKTRVRTMEAIGNENLKPEEIANGELSFDYFFSRFLRAKTTFYAYEVKNFIQYHTVFSGIFLEYYLNNLPTYIFINGSPMDGLPVRAEFINSPKKDAAGIELELESKPFNFLNVGIGYYYRNFNTIEDMVIRLDPDDDPEHQGMLNLSKRYRHRLDGLNTMIGFNYKTYFDIKLLSHFVGYNYLTERPTTVNTREKSVSFWDSDLNFSNLIINFRYRDFRLTGVIYNLFDNKYAQYDDIFDGGPPVELQNNERSYMVSLEYSYKL